MSLSVKIPGNSAAYALDWVPDTPYEGTQWGWVWGADSAWHQMHTWINFNWTDYSNRHINWRRIVGADLTIKLSSAPGNLYTSINVAKPGLQLPYVTWNSSFHSPPNSIAWGTPGGTLLNTDMYEASVLHQIDTTEHTFSIPLAQILHMTYETSNAFLLYSPYQPGSTGTYIYTIGNIPASVSLTIYYTPSLSGDVVMF